jgi:hypothetical protein
MTYASCMDHVRSNQALELTAARTVYTSSMTTSFSPHLTLALGDRSSASSR